MIDTPEYKLIPLTGAETRNLLARREDILVAEERAAVQAALDEAGSELRIRLRQLLRGDS